MDFKVAGTADGVTSLQMDIKISGVDREITRQALYQAKEGRMHILGDDGQTLATPRTEVSGHAPRIITIRVKPDKIREIIGPGGKVIRGIIEATGVKMDVEDDGTVTIASSDEVAAEKPSKWCSGSPPKRKLVRSTKGLCGRSSISALSSRFSPAPMAWFIFHNLLLSVCVVLLTCLKRVTR